MLICNTTVLDGPPLTVLKTHGDEILVLGIEETATYLDEAMILPYQGKNGFLHYLVTTA